MRHLRDDYFREQVYGIFVDVQLLAISLSTGVLDAISYPDFNVFVSNQTGNTIFLAIASVGIERFLLASAAVSLGCFLLSCFAAGRLGLHFGAHTRGWLLLTNAVQTGAVILVYILHATKVIVLDNELKLVYIALLSIASGMQVASARQLQADIPTAMLTSPFAALLVDEHIFKLRNPARDRRLAHILSMLSGAFIGSAVYKCSGTGAAFIVAFAMKFIITLSYFFNPKADQVQEG